MAETVYRAKAAGLSWPLPEDLDETQLETRLSPAAPPPTTTSRAVPDWATLHQELARKGVTLALLWQEYKAQHPDGYQYSRFCVSIGRGAQPWIGVSARSIELVRSSSSITRARPCRSTTVALRQAQIFVAVWGASNYTYAEATWTQTLPDWIGAPGEPSPSSAACRRSWSPTISGPV